MEYIIGTEVTKLSLDEVKKLIQNSILNNTDYYLTIIDIPQINNIIFKEEILYLTSLTISNTLITKFSINLNLFPKLKCLILSSNPKLAKLDVIFNNKTCLYLIIKNTRIKKLKFKNPNLYYHRDVKNNKTKFKKFFYRHKRKVKN